MKTKSFERAYNALDALATHYRKEISWSDVEDCFSQAGMSARSARPTLLKIGYLVHVRRNEYYVNIKNSVKDTQVNAFIRQRKELTNKKKTTSQKEYTPIPKANIYWPNHNPHGFILPTGSTDRNFTVNTTGHPIGERLFRVEERLRKLEDQLNQKKPTIKERLRSSWNKAIEKLIIKKP